MLLGLALHFCQHFIKRSSDALRGLCIKLMPELLGKICKRQQLFLPGRVVYPVREWNRLFIDLYFSYVFGNSFISQQHKLLDQLVRLFTFFYNYPDRFPVAVKLKSYFLGRKINSSVFKPLLSEFLCKLIEQ